jgi:hypothetical protein
MGASAARIAMRFGALAMTVERWRNIIERAPSAWACGERRKKAALHSGR